MSNYFGVLNLTSHLAHISVLLLAAGGSSRFGSPKQLLQQSNKSLLRSLAETAVASKSQSTSVVLGAFEDQLRPELDGLDVRIVSNPGWQKGISSSLRSGVFSLPKDIDAALVMLCDQPRVTPKLLDAIIELYRSSGKSIVASEYAGSLGVPALFDRRLFPEILRLKGDKGAKQLILHHVDDAATLPFPEGVVDIDGPDDARLLRST